MTVDGVDHPSEWGLTIVAVPPGTHHVRVVVNKLGGTDPAEAWIPVATGLQTETFYNSAGTLRDPGTLCRAKRMGNETIAVLVMIGLLGVAVRAGLTVGIAYLIGQHV